jgi:excisionase family DNA binding protein
MNPAFFLRPGDWRFLKNWQGKGKANLCWSMETAALSRKVVSSVGSSCPGAVVPRDGNRVLGKSTSGSGEEKTKIVTGRATSNAPQVKLHLVYFLDCEGLSVSAPIGNVPISGSPVTPDALLLTLPQVAGLCTISVRHAKRLAREGVLPGVVKLGRSVRVSRAGLEAWIKSGCPRPRK